MLMTAGALAADTEGEVRQVNPEDMTITLDDGKTYKLPAEMDVTAIAEGATVIIAYDSRDGVNQITDMLIQ
jgi:outer membrane lipoprotein SlyB